MTAIFAAAGHAFIDRVVARIAERDRSIEVHRDLASAPLDRVEAAVFFLPPAPSLPSMEWLRFAFAPGAGIDGLLRCVGLPHGLPLVRVIDPEQALRMAQYVALTILARTRDFDTLRERQRARQWIRDLPDDEAGASVAVLGYEPLGRASARALAALGFGVTAWTRSPREPRDGDVAIASGFAALDRVLEKSRFVVTMLPLTAETNGLLDRVRLARLPHGAYVINASRAALVDESALLDTLRSGHLSGAALDVFWNEPLPADSPWWNAPNVTVTPHVAAFPRASFVARAFVDTLRRAQAGEPLDNVAGFAR